LDILGKETVRGKEKTIRKKRAKKTLSNIVCTIKYILKACVALWTSEDTTKQEAMPGYQLKSQSFWLGSAQTQSKVFDPRMHPWWEKNSPKCFCICLRIWTML